MAGLAVKIGNEPFQSLDLLRSMWKQSFTMNQLIINLWWDSKLDLKVFGSLGVLWFLIGSYCLRLVIQSLWGQVNSVQSKFRNWELNPPGSGLRIEQGKELALDCASIDWQVMFHVWSNLLIMFLFLFEFIQYATFITF